MRRAVIGFICSALAAPVACTLTTNLDGLAGEALAVADGGGDGPNDAAPSVDASTDVAIDAGDPYRLAVLADKPTAYWTFDEAADAKLAGDSVGGFDAQVEGVVTFGVRGVRGTAIQASQTGRLNVGNHFDFAGQAPYTLEAWIRFQPPTTNVTFYDFFTKRDSTTNGYAFYARYEPNNSVMTVQIEQGGRGSNEEIKQNVWTHVVVTYALSPLQGLLMYVDGVLATSGDYDDHAPTPATTSPLYLLGGFVGPVDEMAIYDHALSPERVRLHGSLGKQGL